MCEGVRDSITGITNEQMTLAPTTDAASLFHWLPAGRIRGQVISTDHRFAALGLCLVLPALLSLPGHDVKRHLAKPVDQYEEDIPSTESVVIQMAS